VHQVWSRLWSFQIGKPDRSRSDGPETGVIDTYAGPTKDELALFPTRVVALPDGRSAYSLTMFKAPGMPDDQFESQYESLRREFDNIRARFAADHPSCRV
jgi:hypothetical protein